MSATLIFNNENKDTSAVDTVLTKYEEQRQTVFDNLPANFTGTVNKTAITIESK